MKITPFYIKNILALALIALICLQSLWLYNMYVSYRVLTANQIFQNLLQSIDSEFINRQQQLGGPITHTCNPFEQDTSAMRNLTIITEDTTYIIPYNTAYLYNDRKAHQSSFKYFIPLNIYNLDSIFHQLLIEANIPVMRTRIELYDIDKKDTIQTGDLIRTPWRQHYKTETVFVDLADSIGIKAYVQTPYFAIFQKMAFQLILSVLLIIGVVSCLFRLSKTIFRQRKEEMVKKDFINALTHELKRPISSSLFTLEYLADQVKENKFSSVDESLADAIFDLKKLNLYVEKIQEISKGEEGKIELTEDVIALEPFFLKLKEKYESSSEEKNISLSLQADKGISLTTDILHFSNIMENLIENAIKYSGESVSIEIVAFQKDGRVRIIHRDNGWGISESELPYIFDKFYRGKSVEKRKKSGFGLGLSYIKIMMKNMNGSISVSSKKNEFTEFILQFPLT